ncbi:MAG: glycosyltransferase family 4 protein [Desulfobacterales bacterium]|nr:glycosyltransferase family 4 protein [Desulfobacterales bacterium]
MSRSNPPVLGMILKGYPRISETFISNEILLLEKLGFSIHIFSMRQPRETFCHDSVKQIKASVDYLPESLLTHLPSLLYHNGMLAKKSPKLYKEAFQMALRRFIRKHRHATLKHLLQAGYLVHKLLPASRAVHLHAHFAHSPTSVAMFAGRLSNVPFSFTAHAKDIYTSDPMQLQEKIAHARFVVTCTQYNKDYLTELSPDETTPIHRIYHGIDIDFFSHNKALCKLKSKPCPPYQILTVARLTPKKGLTTIYKALRNLLDMGFSIRHTLIGDGEDRHQLLALIKELCIGDVTQCLGTLPHQDVLEYYRQSDLFVLGCEIAPNGDRDGIPNVIIESMAMEVPVVATRISAIPEVIIDEKTGLLVPPGRPEKMAQAMVRLLTDMNLRNQIVTAARKLVMDQFDNKILIQDLAAIYRRSIHEFSRQ